MKVELPYGDGTLTATLPDGTRRLSSEAELALPPLADLDGAVRTALASPLGLSRIRHLVKPGARVTIAFDDHTTGSFGPIRPVAIRAVLDELAGAGVSPSQVPTSTVDEERMNALAFMVAPDVVAQFAA